MPSLGAAPQNASRDAALAALPALRAVFVQPYPPGFAPPGAKA